jgi:mono/diheme cytochrome c family protein
MKRIIVWGIGAAALIGLATWVISIVFEDPHVAQGRAVFSHYCTGCHGTKGRGDGFNAPNLDPHPRDLTDRVEPYMAEASNEEIFMAVKEGVAGVFPGSGKSSEEAEEEAMGSTLMPYWGYTLSDQEIWSLVAYIRTLHKNDADPIEFNEQISSQRPRPQIPSDFNLPLADSPEGRKLASMGQHLFEERYACVSCHQINGNGGQVGPDLSRAGFRMNAKWIYRWIQSPQAIKRNAIMPGFNLPDEEAKALVLYLTTLRAAPQPPQAPAS